MKALWQVQTLTVLDKLYCSVQAYIASSGQSLHALSLTQPVLSSTFL